MAAPVTPPSLEIWKLVIPGVIGASAAILGQIVANVFASRRHAKEMQQRDQQLKAQFLSPIAARRLDAYETIYETIQKAVEDRQLTLPDYERARPLFLYLPPALRDAVVNALVDLLRASSSDDEAAIQSAILRLKESQDGVDNELGHSVVAQSIRDLNTKEETN